MIQLNTAVGIIVFLVGMALVGSIAVNLYTQYLLKKCVYILHYCFSMMTSEEVHETLEALRREGTE